MRLSNIYSIQDGKRKADRRTHNNLLRNVGELDLDVDFDKSLCHWVNLCQARI